MKTALAQCRVNRLASVASTTRDTLRTSTGLSGGRFSADRDLFRFTPAATGSYSFVLTWSATTADYDIALMNSAFTQFVAYSETSGTVQPERFTVTLAAGTTYGIRVAGASGPAGDYLLQID